MTLAAVAVVPVLAVAVLLAEEPPIAQHPATWISAVVALIVAIREILGSRDRARLTTLEVRADACEKDRAECRNQLAEAKVELKERDVRDRAVLQSQIDSLKSELAGKKNA